MKPVAKILLAMLLLFTSGIFASNILLKKEYEKTDKNDIYRTYGNILNEPFKHIKIEGGNLSRIVYQQSPNFSVRVAKDWNGFKEKRIKAFVKNDTLYLHFPNTYNDAFERNYLQGSVVLRIFSPQVLSFTGHNTRFEMVKMKQPSMAVNVSGRSEFELESIIPAFTNLSILQQDSSNVQVEMDPALKGPGNYFVKNFSAKLSGVSFLDIGQAKIDSLQLSVADSSGVFLSGSAVKKSNTMTTGNATGNK